MPSMLLRYVPPRRGDQWAELDDVKLADAPGVVQRRHVAAGGAQTTRACTTGLVSGRTAPLAGLATPGCLTP